MLQRIHVEACSTANDDDDDDESHAGTVALARMRRIIPLPPLLLCALSLLFLLLLPLSSLASFPGIPPFVDSVLDWSDLGGLPPLSGFGSNAQSLDLRPYSGIDTQPPRKIIFTKGDRAYIFDTIQWKTVAEISIASVQTHGGC